MYLHTLYIWWVLGKRRNWFWNLGELVCRSKSKGRQFGETRGWRFEMEIWGVFPLFKKLLWILWFWLHLSLSSFGSWSCHWFIPQLFKENVKIKILSSQSWGGRVGGEEGYLKARKRKEMFEIYELWENCNIFFPFLFIYRLLLVLPLTQWAYFPIYATPQHLLLLFFE